ncbi:MAG: ABC transporter permease [Bifidobacteriaceae bacterium]|jgi:putative ABC transport system permease protein|nr:ABC transporter permease [Bifidobacteriaceae bacterium]
MNLLSKKANKRMAKKSYISKTSLFFECLSSLGQKTSRLILTMLGTIFAIAGLVSVMALSTTMNGQVARDFSVIKATQVKVTDAAATFNPNMKSSYSFKANSEAKVNSLAGTVASGITFSPPKMNASVSRFPTSAIQTFEIDAVSTGYFNVIDAQFCVGSAYSEYSNVKKLPTAVIGATVAKTLNILPDDYQTFCQSSHNQKFDQTPIYINGIQYLVTGVLYSSTLDQKLVNNIMLPPNTVISVFGEPSSLSPATMLVKTKIGSANEIAREAPIILSPVNPALFTTTPPDAPSKLQNQIMQSLSLFLFLISSIILIIGAASIINSTLVSVMERTEEIGIRRALGATRKHIIWQFLFETLFIGIIAGLIGSSVGIIAVLIISILNQWTPFISPWLLFEGTTLGAVVGLVSGLYPSFRASRVNPIVALTR